MRKLKLNAEELEVMSFEPAPARRAMVERTPP
jgi:hypothetical protein